MSLRNCHVLMVDDELPNLNLFRRLFKRKVEVHTALSGREALQIMEKVPIDLVLADQRMPEMTGIQFLEEVCLRYPRTARIMVTAFPDAKVAVDAINRGQVSRYLSKPWNNAELERTIEQELRFRLVEEMNEKLALDLQLRNTQLEKANLELTSVDRIKSEFLSNVTHELRTPLISTMGYIDLLLSGRSGDLSADQLRFLEKAMSNVEKLKDLLADLVDFSNHERGLEDAVQSEFNLVKVILDQVDLIEIQARQKAIAILRTLPADTVPIRADMTRIGQAAANLLSNAIKFTPPGGTITVGLEQSRQSVRVFVRDTGIGINPEHLNKVFDRFFQVDSSSTRRFSGAGIGLSLVKSIVNRHGGTVGAESVPGEGSSFWFTLPLPVEEARPRRGRTPSRLKKVVVALVDPDHDHLQHAQSLLIREGFNTIVGETLDDAAFISDHHSVDLILISSEALDAALNPEELLRDIRTTGLALGLYLLKSGQNNAHGPGRSHFFSTLPKPLRAGDILDIVQGSLQAASEH